MKYSATLLLLMLLAVACKKNSTNVQPVPVSPKSYTAKMSGMRHWKGTYARRDVALPPPTAVTDSFQLIVINDSTVSVGYSPYIYVNKYLILHYNAANDTAHTISFLQHFNSYGTTYDSVAIDYYYLSDSIVYTELVTDTTATLITSNLSTL